MHPHLQQFLNVISNVQNTPPEHSQDMLSHIRKLYDQMPDQQTLSFSLFRSADHIMRLKPFNENIQWVIEQCIEDIITRAIDNEFRVGTQALRCIFDTNCEYYKHNHLDPHLKYPLGYQRKLDWYEPDVGDGVDVVKPYITSTSYCCWIRGVLLSKDNKKYTIKYDNSDTPVTQTTFPFFDLLGSRTSDYDWRMNLQIGSHIDAYNKFWYSSTVVQVGVQNGSKRVRVSFRKFSDNGLKIDSDGNRYDGLGPNQDEWMEIFSYRIQKPGKMAKQLCYYSHGSQQMVIDDTYDLLFQKQYEQQPFWCIMRCNFIRSTAYLNFYQYFCNKKGVDTFIQVAKNKDINVDNFINMLVVFANTAFLVPRMGLQRYLPTLMELTLQFSRQNNKVLNPMRLQIITFFIECVGKRLFSLSKKHSILNELRKYFIIEYLKLNLQKQIVAVRMLNELIRPARPYQNDAEKLQFQNYLKDNLIFYKIIQNNVHEQILSRSGDLLRYMMESHIIGWNQIQHIWNIIPHSDLRGRTTIQKLIGDISKDFNFQFTSKIIDKLLNLKQTEITIDKLNLLRTLKDRQLTIDYKVKILNYLWECLTVKSTNIKQNIEEQIQSVFRGFISTIKQNSLKLQVLKAIVTRLKEISTVRNQMHLFKQFLLTYPVRLQANAILEEGNLPQIISEVVIYLKQQKIYETLLKLLSLVKTKEKIESILEFIYFLFGNDKDDISQIVKSIYLFLGPSDQFLLWAKNMTLRAVKFFIELFENTSDMAKFQKISEKGLQALRIILLDVNVYEKNIKIIRKVKRPVMGPVNNPAVNTVGTNTSEVSIRPVPNVQKEEVLIFVYVLKSPFQCKGLSFLLSLLQFIKNSKVYADIIKLIIQFLVNLDDKITEHTQTYRQQFLNNIFKQISALSSSNEYNDSIKLKMQIYLNLIEQLFAQTQKQGLASIRPHFATIQGQTLTLKIQNTIIGSQINRKQNLSIQVNENMTLWDFKVKLSHIYLQMPQNIDLIKYASPIQQNLHGKSLSQLHFFNDEGIKISKKSSKQIPRYELLTENNLQLSQKFKQIVEKWFSKYHNEHKILTLDDLIKLAAQNWKGSIFKQKQKLQQIITKYDHNNKGGLSLQQFSQFFIKKSKQNLTVVWRIINLAGYRNNLKHKDDMEIQFGENVFPRRILSSKIIYNIIFQVLSNEAFQPSHVNFYKLLTMLQTDHQLCNNIKLNIRQFLQNQKCMYRLSYGLQSLINQLQNNLELYGQFYEHNGHLEIANKLANFFKQGKSIYTFDMLSKKVVIPNLLKIINLYLYPLISMNKYVRFIKKVKVNHHDLQQFFAKLANENNYANEQLQKRQILLQKQKPFNIDELYKLAYDILQNEIVNYTTDYLIRVTFEVTRLFGSLANIYPGFNPECIINGIKCQSMNLRRACQAITFVYLLDHQCNALDLLDKLIDNMPTVIKFASNHYFLLVAVVLQKSIVVQKDPHQNDQYYKNFALRLIDLVYKSPNEQRGSNISNKLLQGLLANILLLFTQKPHICKQLSYLKEDIVRKCLFFYDSKQKIHDLEIKPELLLNFAQPQLFEDYVKCKSDETRKLLMEIIFIMYKNSQEENSSFFDTFILPVLNQLPDNTKKTSTKCMQVGLNNLGSTCYMNSMLQILNSIDTFRNAIMMANTETPLLHQIKSLFSYLFFSQRLDYVPKDLLTSFVPPINPGIQQDTTQFLNFLFDQIQESLKNSPYKKLLQQIFRGNQVAQMICHGCGAKRQRQEPFFTYSVEIQGKYDLYSALEGMHNGELISDCLCETCGNRSDTTKRNVLNQVPNIFFVHLKRIVFNYDVFINTKIHTRLFFPEELNLEPYTKQGIQLRQKLGVQYMKSLKQNEEQMKKFQELALHGKDKKYYQLKLKGIIVHSGTPDVGHYYTILKKQNNWIKFDDSRVTGFSASSFEEECFGGSWIADQWGGFGSSKNAYVLIYQKQLKKEIQIQQMAEDNIVIKKSIPYQNFKTYNTVDWYKQVWLDNHSLMLEQHLTGESFTKDFLNFIWKMLQIMQTNSIIEIISQIFYKISALSGEVGSLLQIFNKNTHLINTNILDKYVLADSKKTFNLLFHQNPKVRQFAACYLERVLIICYLNGDADIKGKVMKFVQQYLHLLHGEAAKNWLRIDGYFKLFQKLIISSLQIPLIYQFFVYSDLIAYFLDFVLQKSSPLNVIQKKYSLGTKSNPVNFQSGLNIVSLLFKRSYGVVGQNFQIPLPPAQTLFHLSDNSITCLTSMHLYQKMIKQNQNAEAVSALIQRLCIKNPDFSLGISRVLLHCFNDNTQLSDELETVMLCIMKVLTIKDQYWQLRAQAILGTSMPFIFQKNLINATDEERFIYPSILDNIFPLESLLSYAHINRLRIPITVLNMIKTILQSCSVSEFAMQFLLKQPGPSISHLRYIDWIGPYVSEVINLLSVTEKKKQQLINKIQICKLYLSDLQKYKKDMFSLITGQIGQKVLVKTITDQKNNIQVNIYNVPTFAVPSQPNGHGNTVVDQYLTNGRLETQVTSSSNILKLFKQNTKPLAIKPKNIEEDEDKELIGLFDQNPYPKLPAETNTKQNQAPKQQAKMDIQSNKNQTMSQDIKPAQLVELTQINIQNTSIVPDYIRFIQIINKTDSNKLAIIDFSVSAYQNGTLPLSIRVMVSKKQQFWYTKSNPYVQWGSSSFKIYSQNYTEPAKRYFGRRYPNPYQQVETFTNNDKVQPQHQKDNKQQVIQKFDDFNEAEMNCPVCTMLNPISNSSCDICQSSLH